MLVNNATTAQPLIVTERTDPMCGDPVAWRALVMFGTYLTGWPSCGRLADEEILVASAARMLGESLERLCGSNPLVGSNIGRR
ncbi:hypothetical protein LAUMK191_00436 [Mycobacterium attenuatum]|nr:hypothetical protein LAUMK191_00436 [Mycobacterium attenuatum]